MLRFRIAATGALLAGSACQTYAPEPVDLAAHAEAWSALRPDAPSVAEFIAELRARAPEAPAFDPSDGIALGEAELLALLLNADLRRARLAAGVAQASRDEAGRWLDPELRFDVGRVVEDVPHQWLGGVEVGFTLPLTGRPGLEKDLANAEYAAALVDARAAEAAVLDALDERFCEWSTAQLEIELLDALLVRLRAIEDIAVRLANAGELTAIDARTFTLERIQREIERARADAHARELALDVASLTGFAPEAELRLVPAFVPDARAREQLGPAEVRTAAARADGPQLARARAAHESAERRLALAVRKQWPELSLIPGFSYEDGEHRYGGGIGFTLPLWNRNAREIAEARAARALAAEDVRGAFERVVQGVARAELGLAAATAECSALERDLVPLVDRQVEDGRRLADLGTLDSLLLLDGLVRAHEAKARVLDARLDEARATVRLNSFFWPRLGAGENAEASR